MDINEKSSDRDRPILAAEQVKEDGSEAQAHGLAR